MTLPESGCKRPERTAKRVDLPLPEGPMSRAIWPGTNSIDTSRKATVSVSPLPKERVKLQARRLGDDPSRYMSVPRNSNPNHLVILLAWLIKLPLFSTSEALRLPEV